MNKMFYPKLAVNNLKKNARTYIPYVLTSIITVMMFYIMGFISTNQGLEQMSGGSTLKSILAFGEAIIGIFSVIFLFYTNSFLMKGRKQEIGLFNILGMEKRHIAKVLFFETIYTIIISLLIGLGLGILMSKLMLVVLFFIVRFEVPFGFEISVDSILYTCILFIFIFVLNLIYNLKQIHTANPIELLHGGQQGEKEPRVKWIIVLIGVICLGGGYVIANTTESPLNALVLFFVAVLLVIIGTYAIFTAGSIFILKILRKNKKFYYKTNHFISVSGMIYRMKQNAVGLANICILSTGVLVMLSGTLSLYAGMEDIQNARYPKEIRVNIRETDGGQEVQRLIERILEEKQVEPQDVSAYSYTALTVQPGSKNVQIQDKDGNDESIGDGNISQFTCLTLEEYNRIHGTNKELAENEILLYYKNQDALGDHIKIGDNTYFIKEKVGKFKIDNDSSDEIVKSYYLVFNSKESIEKAANSLYEIKEPGEFGVYAYGFNIEGNGALQLEVAQAIKEEVSGTYPNMYIEAKEEGIQLFLASYGGLFFLGIFLGILFIIATVLIMYYKQISEGYEDKKRFEIMQKVGMSHKEVRKSIRSQVLMVFFLPLVMAIIHIAAAFKMITKLLAIFSMLNIGLFAICTIGTIVVFGIFYGVVYWLTARVYYRIVS